MKLVRRRSELEARRAAPPGFTSLATMTTKLQNLTHTTCADRFQRIVSCSLSWGRGSG